MSFLIDFGLAADFLQRAYHQFLCTDSVQFITCHPFQVCQPSFTVLNDAQQEQDYRPKGKCDYGYQEGNVGKLCHIIEVLVS